MKIIRDTNQPASSAHLTGSCGNLSNTSIVHLVKINFNEINRIL